MSDFREHPRRRAVSIVAMIAEPATVERYYRAVRSRDQRFDGWFVTAVTSTGIYCRPSCPAMTPKPSNVRFYRTAAAAQLAGFRACRRCRPDATPGSPEWDQRADLVGQAMRLIADGIVDREGVAGLARRLGYSERHVHRQLVADVGAGPVALARAQRAHTARVLIETTRLPFTQIAFAAGFTSIRQFNATVRMVFATTPSELRRSSDHGGDPTPGQVVIRLPFRRPLDLDGLLAFLAARAIPGVEEVVDGVFRRTLRLPNGGGIAELSGGGDHIRCVLRLDDLRDLRAAVERCTGLLDLDADPVAVDGVLSEDPLIGSLVRAHPGRRVAGAVDGPELAVRAVLGQQVSVAAARTIAGRLVTALGDPLPVPDGHLTHRFPDPGTIAGADLSMLPVPEARRACVRRLAGALAAGDVVLEPGADRASARRGLRGLRGIGPWTAAYVAMRALGDPDAFMPGDHGVRRAMQQLGQASDAGSVSRLAERWRPWRAYATQYLWAANPATV